MSIKSTKILSSFIIHSKKLIIFRNKKVMMILLKKKYIYTNFKGK
jgi:hypothetical protein